MSRTVVNLKSHPVGFPKESDYQIVSEQLGELKDGQVRIKSLLVSVDPYLRGMMSGVRNAYFVPFELGSPVHSYVVGKVVESKNSKFSVGDRVTGNLPWADVSDVSEKDIGSLHKIADDVSNESALSTVGLTGLTAWVGLVNVGKVDNLKPGSTVFVSGAAGATGNVVGQIAKIKGFRVVGTAGSDDKISWLKNELKFDEAINYRTTPDLKEALKAACPNGIDLYYDNVGGKTLDFALELMNRRGVIVNCGSISSYNAVDPPQGPRVEWHMIVKSLRMEGFIYSDYADDWGTAAKELSGWLKEGKLIERINPIDSVGDVSGIPKGFIDMLGGKNIGKTLVRVASE